MKTSKEKLISGELAIYCNSAKEADAVVKEFCIKLSVDENYTKVYSTFAKDEEGYSFFNNKFVKMSKTPTIRAKNFLASLENEAPQREIIGYECPMDLYGGKLKKGEIIVIKTSGQVVNEKQTKFYFIPDEIVKTWTPIYKKTEAEEQAEMWDEFKAMTGITGDVDFLIKTFSCNSKFKIQISKK